ncbi:MAG: dihydroorotate dehydrogenase electron transfer subunit [Solobacterium sp.]|nr:dihydroorotate dehydrogenase electron transfer subunit [Solobacterium sp.]
MRNDTALITEQVMIAPDIMRMELETGIAADTSCGQFIQILVPGYFLRRPISVSQVRDDNHLSLIYRIAGDGTRVLSQLKAGVTLDIFGPLGHGFPVIDEDVVLIGGGVGIPPLIETAKRHIMNGHHVTAVLGFASDSQIFAKEELESLNAEVIIATMDGSCGVKGTVMDAVHEYGISKERTVMACGPLGMLRVIGAYFEHGYVSLEERMACGIGACMGCVARTPEGDTLRVCKDGPVFEIGKVVL